MKQHLVRYVLCFTRYQVQPFFSDVQPKFCFVWPRWCLSRTFVLSKEKNYLQPFPGSWQVLKSEIPSCIYMPVLTGERKGMQISRSALEVKGQRDGTVVRVLTSHQGARVQIQASMPYVDWVSCWFSPLVQEVFLRVLQFSPLLKTNISKFSFDQESGQQRTTRWMCYLQIIIYLFIYLFRGEEQGCAIVAPGDPLGRLLQ